MANLAIQGHPTRGREVIAWLEMLGGINTARFKGEKTELAYYIEVDKSICCIDIEIEYHTEFYKITLEQFEEKFPYKVMDKVNAPCKGCIKTITSMEWNTYSNTVTYKLDNRIYTNIDQLKVVNDLQSYKEETMETITIDDFKANTKEWLIDKLHGMVISDAVKIIGNIHDELHKPKYPKTYKGCCRIVNADPLIRLKYDLSDGQKYSYDVDNLHLYENLRQLLIARDAYWKIAGEQMELGKPWEPDWLNVEQDKYVLFTHNNAICSNRYVLGHNFLAFPTKEMRDAFYENFKELIEPCKELL